MKITEAIFECPTHIVGGNNDFFSRLPREEEFELEGHHIFITHGHAYYVSMGEAHLQEEARRRGADIVDVWAHTCAGTYNRRRSCDAESGQPDLSEAAGTTSYLHGDEIRKETA